MIQNKDQDGKWKDGKWQDGNIKLDDAKTKIKFKDLELETRGAKEDEFDKTGLLTRS